MSSSADPGPAARLAERRPARYLVHRPARRARWRPVIAAMLAALATAGCSASGLLPGSSSSRTPAGTDQGPAAGSPARDRPAFTVRGSVPVAPSSSQDTHARAGGSCQPRRLHRYQALGEASVISFTSTGASTAATLLSHFLAGQGTAVRFGAGSPASREARASRAFRNLNAAIQAGVLAELRAGRRHVRLASSQLPPLRFGLHGSRDLYLSFRGTQGLSIRGSGTLRHGRYAGQLTYVIRDSYGFSVSDQLLGVGTAMRYLQTSCGHPPVTGGAHWFPDSVTVTVPFRHRRAG